MTAGTIHDEAVTGELVPYTADLDEYRPRIVMAPDEAKALDDSLRSAMRAVLHPDVDYGVIPGTNKPSLLKPGAEKLLQWFGFGHTMEPAGIERDADGNRVGVTYKCVVTKGMPSGRRETVSTCDGYAGYDEDRFYTSAEAATLKERANAARYRREANPAKCVEYRAPWNSVIKMAQKRAMVGAALTATSASSLFTQDVEDEAPSPGAAVSVADIAGGIIRGLPVETRRAFDRWYRDSGLPARTGDWTAYQWCAALVEAGRLDTAAAGEPTPTADEPSEQETGVTASRGQIGVIHAHFKRLGYEDHEGDREERLVFTGRLAGTGPLETSSSLTSEQARHVARQLEVLKDRAELVALLHPADQGAAA